MTIPNPSVRKHAWENFAETDPYTYIMTDLKGRDPQRFWDSGKRIVEQELLPLIEARGVCPRIGMELGCGVGRLVLPLAVHLQEVVGVDIADGMIQRAKLFAQNHGIGNVRFAAISGPEDLLQRAKNYEGRVSFLYSLLVFQHIPDFAMIGGYLHAISILLEENGIGYLQFDTRPKTFAYQFKSSLPDFLLPRFWRRGIRRIRRFPEEIERGIYSAGLEIIGELTPGSAYHRYILRRTPRLTHAA